MEKVNLCIFLLHKYHIKHHRKSSERAETLPDFSRVFNNNDVSVPRFDNFRLFIYKHDNFYKTISKYAKYFMHIQWCIFVTKGCNISIDSRHFLLYVLPKKHDIFCLLNIKVKHNRKLIDQTLSIINK